MNKYKNDPTDTCENAPSELEIAEQKYWNEFLKRQDLEIKIYKKDEALKILVNVFKTMAGKDYIVNELTKIIEL
jgi:hypothetical protein